MSSKFTKCYKPNHKVNLKYNKKHIKNNNIKHMYKIIKSSIQSIKMINMKKNKIHNLNLKHNISNVDKLITSASSLQLKVQNQTNISSIDELIEKTLSIKLTESAEDIEDLGTIIKCKICNSLSGTLKILCHNFKCKYYINEYTDTLVYGTCVCATTPIDSTKAKFVGMREAIVIDKNSSIKIIGTYGAGPCIIVGIRDRISTKTLLSHIDANMLNPINIFNIFSPASSDVYLIGGDNSSKKEINELINQIVFRGFEIKFTHLIDDNSNSFGINAETGDVFF